MSRHNRHHRFGARSTTMPSDAPARKLTGADLNEDAWTVLALILSLEPAYTDHRFMMGYDVQDIELSGKLPKKSSEYIAMMLRSLEAAGYIIDRGMLLAYHIPTGKFLGTPAGLIAKHEHLGNLTLTDEERERIFATSDTLAVTKYEGTNVPKVQSPIERLLENSDVIMLVDEKDPLPVQEEPCPPTNPPYLQPFELSTNTSPTSSDGPSS